MFFMACDATCTHEPCMISRERTEVEAASAVAKKIVGAPPLDAPAGGCCSAVPWSALFIWIISGPQDMAKLSGFDLYYNIVGHLHKCPVQMTKNVNGASLLKGA